MAHGLQPDLVVDRCYDRDVRFPGLAAAVALIAGSAAVAQANPTGQSDVDPADERHPWIALGELGVALAIPAAYYASTKEHQAVDFDLGNDWESWKTKLFSTEKLKFDTNPFHINALRHPIQGVVDYHIVRTNGFSSTAAMLVTVVKGLLWEYVIEYREDPSINDIIFNPAAAMAVGEPMYQIGQLWRGSRITLRDRVRTAVFSPFDAFHDTHRRSKRWFRPSVWRTIDLAAGANERVVQTRWISELGASADIDLVTNRAYAEGGAYDGFTRTGEWSRLRISARVGQGRDGNVELTGTQLRSRTSWFGRYTQDEDGNGRFLGIGTAFTYRNDWLGTEKDRIAIGHLVGIQLQLSRRRPEYELRWEIAGYLDFALVQSLVFNRQRPFPRPPPYYSSLQSDGYIDAFGTSLATRLRFDSGPWHLDLEIDGNVMHQVAYHDRDPDGTGSNVVLPPGTLVTATGIDEQRGLWRAQVTYRPGRWGFAVAAEGAERRSSWRDETRQTSEISLGLSALLAY